MQLTTQHHHSQVECEHLFAQEGGVVQQVIAKVGGNLEAARRTARDSEHDNSDGTRGRRVGYDVPDFPATKPPTAKADLNGTGLAAHSGAAPFTMNAEGRSRLFAPGGQPLVEKLERAEMVSARMLKRVAGAEDGIRDALTRYTTPVSGSYYFVLSVEALRRFASPGDQVTSL